MKFLWNSSVNLFVTYLTLTGGEMFNIDRVTAKKGKFPGFWPCGQKNE